MFREQDTVKNLSHQDRLVLLVGWRDDADKFNSVCKQAFDHASKTEKLMLSAAFAFSKELLELIKSAISVCEKNPNITEHAELEAVLKKLALVC